MLALIMAGGEGSRLGMGEKPLVNICGRPMVSYVIDAFLAADHEVVVVASHRTPFTKNWCRAQGLTIYDAKGLGYVEDINAAAADLEEEENPSSPASPICHASQSISSPISRPPGAARGCRHAPHGCPAISVWNMAAAHTTQRSSTAFPHAPPGSTS